jgi:hypothetical protein
MGTAVMEPKAKPNVRMTPRDAAALEWLSQMYGAPLDVVAKLTGTTEKRAYAVVKRWKDGGWVESGRIDAGPMWVWTKRQTAAAYLDWDPGYWVPRASTVAHLRASAVTRMALAGEDVEAWVPERRLRRDTPKHERGQREPYLPDGMWRSAEDEKWRAVEVELNAKGTTRTRAVIANAMAAIGKAAGAGVVYVCASEAVAAGVRDAVAFNAARFEGGKGEEMRRAFQVLMLDDLAQQVGLPATTGLIWADNEKG